MSTTKKTILLATDGLVNVQVDTLAKRLSQVCKHLRFESHSKPIDLGKGPISNPSTYKRIKPAVATLLRQHSLVMIATELPYDNNYFLDSDDSTVIVSFWGWSSLTNLPKNNGMVGFLNSILADELSSGERHDENTGCVYDFLWDKSGIDTRLRSGAMCRSCFANVQERAKKTPNAHLESFNCTLVEGLEDLTTLLDEVSQASKREVDVLTRWETRAGVQQEFDVFLCHNSDDKDSVRKLYDELKVRMHVPWFDEQHLRPGVLWQRELEAVIPRIRSAAVIVGPNGQGPWQDRELDLFLREFVSRGCPVIPVLLKDAGDTPELPLFLRSFTWVDFRKSTPDPWKQLSWGITGTKPE